MQWLNNNKYMEENKSLTRDVNFGDVMIMVMLVNHAVTDDE